MESMGVATGCGCKEVYRFPHTTYLVSVLFCSRIPTFLFIKKKMFFVLVPVIIRISKGKQKCSSACTTTKVSRDTYNG